MQRIFRVVRVFKPLTPLLRTFSRTFRTCFPVLGLLLCVMYFYSVIGMQFFAGKFTQLRIPAESPYALLCFFCLLVCLAVCCWFVSVYVSLSLCLCVSISLCVCRYAQSKYWSVNFDDFANSMLTLFSLVIINNWQNLMDGKQHTHTAPSLSQLPFALSQITHDTHTNNTHKQVVSQQHPVGRIFSTCPTTSWLLSLSPM